MGEQPSNQGQHFGAVHRTILGLLLAMVLLLAVGFTRASFVAGHLLRGLLSAGVAVLVGLGVVALFLAGVREGSR